MIKIIMRHEWRSLRVDRTLWFITTLFALLIGYGASNGSAWVAFQQTALSAAQNEERSRYSQSQAELTRIEQGAKAASAFTNPRLPSVAASRAGTRYAILPPGPLASLSVGQSDLYPYYFRVSSQSRQTFLNNEEVENPANLLAGRFDPSFVIIYIYPLLILVLSYNLLSAEREQGTLQMILSQPVRLRDYVLGKVLVRTLIILSFTFGLSITGFLISGGKITTGEGFSRLLLWMGTVGVYGAFWFSLAILVNGAGRSSATNALSLAGLWLLFVLLIPSILNLVVTTIHPVPSRIEMIQATRRASTEATARGSALMARYLEDHPELVTGREVDPNDFVLRSLAIQAETERLVQPVIDHFDQQTLLQQSLIDRWRFLSPAIVTQSTLNDVAGTSFSRYRHFLRLVEDFHQKWRSYFTPLLIQRVELRSTDYDNFPVFQYEEESLGSLLSRVLIGLFGLSLPVIMTGWLGIRTLRRYSIGG